MHMKMKEMQARQERKDSQMRQEHHMKRDEAYEPKAPESHDTYPEMVMNGTTKPYC